MIALGKRGAGGKYCTWVGTADQPVAAARHTSIKRRPLPMLDERRAASLRTAEKADARFGHAYGAP